MDGPLLIGIEIGGTKLQLGLGRGDGRLLALERRTVDKGRGADGIRAQILAALPDLLDRVDAGGERPDALGIGFGGPVDAIGGVVTTSHQIEGWDGFPLADWARDATGVPRVVLQNDADAAALGEVRFGAGAGLSPVLYVTVGSGIGGGLVVDGAIYRGAGLGAVEIGHLVLDASNEGPRTLEDIASGWSIAREAARRMTTGGVALDRLCGGDPARLDAAIVAKAAGEGDPTAVAVLAEAARAMGRALGHAVTLIAPRRIVLGGGVSLIDDRFWLDPIREEAERRAFPPFRGSFDIVPASLGEEVVVHGALALALDAARRAQ